LKVLKLSFEFLENPFLVNVIENGCPISHPILTNKVNLEIKHLKILENENLKQYKINCRTIMEFWKYVSMSKYSNIKNQMATIYKQKKFQY